MKIKGVRKNSLTLMQLAECLIFETSAYLKPHFSTLLAEL